MKVKEFYDEPTFTLTYLVYDEGTKDAVVIDPVLDYEPFGSKVATKSAEEVISFIKDNNLKLHYILETHAHADHLTGAQYIKEKIPSATTAIHKNITLVQEAFKGLFNFGDDFDTTGKAFDKLLNDGEKLQAGSIEVDTIHTPGHTPACVSYLVNKEAVFTGDALFMPDFGTGRCDFPAGSAEDLYNSIHNKLYELPDDTKVYTGHDYQPGGRDLKFMSTIGEEKTSNIQLKAETTKEEFVEFRNNRDAGLMAPHLLLQSIQVNAQNGELPKPENNGMSYLKIPIRE